jgi:hypothetical protein
VLPVSRGSAVRLHITGSKALSRHKGGPKKGFQTNDTYVKLEDRMTNSAAWTALSFKACWVYVELMKKYDHDEGYGRLILCYAEVRWKMTATTFAAAIKELVRYGFSRIVKKGGLEHQPNVYARCDDWERISREIVTQEGKEAIRLGLARKTVSKDNLKNLVGKRTWEQVR